MQNSANANFAALLDLLDVPEFSTAAEKTNTRGYRLETQMKMRDFLKPQLVRQEIARGTVLLHQGDLSESMIFVEEGCLRLWRNSEGIDTTLQFFLKGDPVSSFQSFFRDQPSRFSIEAVAPSIVETESKTIFLQTMRQSQEFRDCMHKMVATRLSDYQDLFLNRITESPESRYRFLVQENSQLIDIVPQHYIASYLGVTHVSLSRIRKRIGVLNNQ